MKAEDSVFSARAVFRRFLRYIRLSLEKRQESGPQTEQLDNELKQKGLIDKDFVEKAAPKEMLAEDMDATLSRLFPKNPEARLTAVAILNSLNEQTGVNQKTLAEQLDLPEYRLSRILSRLEAEHMITKEKAGLGKIIKLAQPT